MGYASMISRGSTRQTPNSVSAARARLLDEMKKAGVSDPAVLAAVAKVPREQFVDDALKNRAYENNALPIGHAQTISQPVMVAFMTQALTQGRKLERVLEIGTGSGYQRSEEHTSELQSLMRNSYAVFCLKKKKKHNTTPLNKRDTHTNQD